MKTVTLTPDRLLNIYLRIGMAGVKTFTFTDSAGAAISYSGETLTATFYKPDGSIVLASNLEISGAGFNIGTLTLESDETNTIRPSKYFWTLTYVDIEKIYLNGTAYFLGLTEPFDGVENVTETVTILDEGEEINITIS